MSKPAQQNDPRTRFNIGGSTRGPPSAVGSMAPALAPSAQQRTPARTAPRKPNERARPCRPGDGVRARGVAFFHYLKRLSATDISALASMKNVAKCDTWCELQNPVNHRVFERKLRPKPLGRGHACLGVTHRCPLPNPPLLERGRGHLAVGGYWPPVCRMARGWPKYESSATDAVTFGGQRNLELPSRVRRRSDKAHRP